jgi:hypothetical protein
MIIIGIILLFVSLFSLIKMIQLPLYSEGGSGLMMERGIYLLSPPVLFLFVQYLSTMLGGILTLISLRWDSKNSDLFLFMCSAMGILILGGYSYLLLKANRTKVEKLIEKNYKSEKWNLYQIAQIIHDGRISILARLGLTWCASALIATGLFIAGLYRNYVSDETSTLGMIITWTVIIGMGITLLRIRDSQRTSIWKNLLRKGIISAIPEGQLSGRRWAKDNFIGFDTMKDLNGNPILDDQGLPRLNSPLPPLYDGESNEKAETSLQNKEISERGVDSLKHGLNNDEVSEPFEKSASQFKNEELRKTEEKGPLPSEETSQEIKKGELPKKRKRISIKW